jgi:hypothetical protein
MMDPLTFFVVKPTKERIRDFERNTIQIYHIHIKHFTHTSPIPEVSDNPFISQSAYLQPDHL